MSILDEIKKVKFYVAFCALVLVIFFWSTARGYKVWGDDNEVKERAKTNTSHTNRFYHK